MSGRSSRTAAEVFPCATSALRPRQLLGDVTGGHSPGGLRPCVERCHELIALLRQAGVQLAKGVELTLHPFEPALHLPVLPVELPHPSGQLRSSPPRRGDLGLELGDAGDMFSELVTLLDGLFERRRLSLAAVDVRDRRARGRRRTSTSWAARPCPQRSRRRL